MHTEQNQRNSVEPLDIQESCFILTGITHEQDRVEKSCHVHGQTTEKSLWEKSG